MAGEDERELVVAEGPVVVGVPGQGAVEAGPPDEDQAGGPPVEPVPQVFQGRWGEAIG